MKIVHPSPPRPPPPCPPPYHHHSLLKYSGNIYFVLFPPLPPLSPPPPLPPRCRYRAASKNSITNVTELVIHMFL